MKKKNKEEKWYIAVRTNQGEGKEEQRPSVTTRTTGFE